MKRIFIFDLDGTLGKKTPSFPDITPNNAKCLRQLASSKENFLCLATGRPKPQTLIGMSKGGIDETEMNSIFPGQVYEDGLFVEFENKEIYNAVDDSPELFKKVKSGFFDSHAKDFFRTKGFLLVSGRVVKKNGDNYQQLDYTDAIIGNLDVENELIPLYQQGNVVRETLKLPLGFEEDDLKKQSPIFERISEIAHEYLDSRFPNWRSAAELVTWQDSVEIYPKLNHEGVFIKGIGLGRFLNKIKSSSSVAYVCCDNRNDISLVKWVAENFSNYHIICPSNIHSDLQKSLASGKFRYTILKEDCTELGKGLMQFIQDER